MPAQHPKDPLHGVTLETILTRLVEAYGWKKMGEQIRIRCFHFDPSVKSSLTFLRKTPWARAKVEDLYKKFCHQCLKAERKKAAREQDEGFREIL
ncbi:MAG TPA: VF530 family protein [Candidatus Omnitrophota bacterium]|nr:VF530 family protein [Candidatus Omnitrophota bacterium]HPS36408.1 VF530 family protein [Candidatus Omnitrophota bacterium]